MEAAGEHAKVLVDGVDWFLQLAETEAEWRTLRTASSGVCSRPACRQPKRKSKSISGEREDGIRVLRS